jgi:hypothetical protein
VHPRPHGAEPSCGSYGVVLRMQLMVLPMRSLKQTELFLFLIKYHAMKTYRGAEIGSINF